MESAQPSILRRLVAILVLLLVVVVAVRLAVGFVAGLVTAVLWVGVLVALVAGVLWARSTLKRGRRERTIEEPPARQVAAPSHEDRVALETERIQEEMRRQGRG
jgi:H+/Cl- antiporter ClcA